MTDRMKVRLYATAEIRVPLVTEIDLDEYREWVEQSGDVLVEIEPEGLLEWLTDSPDDEYDLAAEFPKPDVTKHDLMSFDIDELEILRRGDD
ncbi:MAG: hypothetical protein ACTHXC_00550 [Brachybacterium sp.]